MKLEILQGDVFKMLPKIQPGSIDCVVTSPPYWALRSYLPKGHELKKFELGSEPTPQDYIANMIRVFSLVRDTMADHATCWVNIGDTYAVGMCLIPQRLAIALSEDGWIVRSVIVWHKPAPMPASVSGWMWRKCRVKVADRKMRRADSSAHRPRLPVNGQGYDWADAVTGESTAQWRDCPGCAKCEPNNGLALRRGSWRPTSAWEPILMLAKSAKYFADGESVKQPIASATTERNQYTRVMDVEDEPYTAQHDHDNWGDGAGANLRDVWTIASEPLREKHFAAYPSKLVENCLKAGTSQRGYCVACGAPWVRVVEQVDTGKKQKMADGWDTGEGAHGAIHRNGRQQGETGVPVMASQTIGWKPSCTCPPAEPRPGRVLDPFAGSGRTLITARRLGLDAVGVELNPEYAAMAERLAREDMPLFS